MRGRIERALNEQARAESVKSTEYRDWDRAFHLEIAKASGNAGTFAYQVNDGANVATQSKVIERQVFRPPGTVCQ